MAQKKSVICVGRRKSKKLSAAVAGAWVRPAAADSFLRFYLARDRFQNEPPPPPWVEPLEEVWVELPPESLELDSFGRSVRCTSR